MRPRHDPHERTQFFESSAKKFFTFIVKRHNDKRIGEVMADSEKVSKIARLTLRIFLIANLVFGAAIIVAIVASFPLAGTITSRLVLKYGASLNVADVLLAGRLMLLLGIVTAAVLHRVLASLLAILATVRDGDAFTVANAARLRSIGWALLIFQILDLVMGAFAAWFAALHVDIAAWSPGFGGWIAVLLAFVLAGVFERGAEMRDDLATTI